jgi:hypothetical protein
MHISVELTGTQWSPFIVLASHLVVVDMDFRETFWNFQRLSLRAKLPNFVAAPRPPGKYVAMTSFVKRLVSLIINLLPLDNCNVSAVA